MVGKPAQEFFRAAIADMGVEQAVMVGDDVEADVGGAMAAGLARRARAHRQVPPATRSARASRRRRSSTRSPTCRSCSRGCRRRDAQQGARLVEVLVGDAADLRAPRLAEAGLAHDSRRARSGCAGPRRR